MFTLKDLNLEKFSYDKKYQRYLEALNIFIEQMCKNPNITQIFVHGSFIKGKLHKDSDLDFDIIDPKITKTEQIRININDVEVDYIVINREIVLKKFKNNDKLFIKGVSNWVRVYGDDSYDDLIEKAKFSS